MFLLFVFFSGPIIAVEPGEILIDQDLEDRAREISKKIRCPVCQNESIDESDASLAKDLRIIIRERLKKGENNKEIENFIVRRYGEFVLLEPNKVGANIILWLSAPVMAVLAFILMFKFFANQRLIKGEKVHTRKLTKIEKKQLEDLLKNGN